MCVTRFATFLKFQKSLAIFDSIFGIWQSFETSLYVTVLIFIMVNGQILKKIIQPSGHTGCSVQICLFE